MSKGTQDHNAPHFCGTPDPLTLLVSAWHLGHSAISCSFSRTPWDLGVSGVEMCERWQDALTLPASALTLKTLAKWCLIVSA